MSLDLSKSERKRLAKAARELAGEYADGRGPELERYSWCGCAAGQVFKRSGVDNGLEGENARRMDSEFGLALTAATSMEKGSLYWSPLPGAVVFPLLWFADWLEEQ